MMPRFDRSVDRGEIDAIRTTFAQATQPRRRDLLGPNGRMLPVVWMWACETHGRTLEDM